MPRRLLKSILLCVAASALLATPASAKTFVVDSQLDEPADPESTPGDCSSTSSGACTLRTAIMDANALAGDDTIIVPAGTYALTIPHSPIFTAAPADSERDGDLDIRSDVTLRGDGARQTVIDASGIDRVFDIAANVPPKVTISGATIQGGAPPLSPPVGGGIRNAGTLHISDSAIVDNPATSSQELSIAGAGVYNASSLTLERVLVARNRTNDKGGGIYNDGGTVDISNSTISGNEAANGAGIFNPVETLGPVRIDYTTIARNTADSGAAAIDWGDAQGEIRDSIVAHNTGASQCSAGSAFSTGHNIESGTDCNFTATGDRQSTDPRIGALADNGGQTDTHAPARDSVAIDSASETCSANDQRLFHRPWGPRCDIGAVELHYALPQQPQQPQEPPPGAPRPASLIFDPTTAERRPGETHEVTATVRNDDGSPAAGASVRWEVAGANDSAGAVTTGQDGTARIAWRGIHLGNDGLTAYVDSDGNLTPDAGEPRGAASVDWKLPPPVQGRTVNADPVFGRVRVLLPASASRAKNGVRAAGTPRWLELAEAAQLPVGTQFDTRHGHVELTGMRSSGTTLTAEFNAGRFTLQQSIRGVGVVEAKLAGAIRCSRSRRAGSADTGAARHGRRRARTRRLWGRTRGRTRRGSFRTRGRFSTATVRGTTWHVRDACTTTTTTVRSGTVTVRDLVKRKNIRVKRGKRYVARKASRR